MKLRRDFGWTDHDVRVRSIGQRRVTLWHHHTVPNDAGNHHAIGEHFSISSNTNVPRDLSIPGQPSPAVQQTLENLRQLGPSGMDLLDDFHTTCLLIHHGGSAWQTWNAPLRQRLVDSQVKSGDQAGSWWNPDDTHAASGGRLFQTALSTLALEVYYRHLPLFQTRR